MEFFVYRSHARVSPNSPEACEIVATSVRRNGAAGLTGFLHHEPGLFVQYVEGPPLSLWDLWDRLGRDARHDDVTLIGKGLLSHRFFDDWRMGYSNGDIACFLDFLQESAGTSLLAQASARETIWFLRGACQRLDLGLAQ